MVPIYCFWAPDRASPSGTLEFSPLVPRQLMLLSNRLGLTGMLLYFTCTLN